jgi:hypothetical protein
MDAKALERARELASVVEAAGSRDKLVEDLAEELERVHTQARTIGQCEGLLEGLERSEALAHAGLAGGHVARNGNVKRNAALTKLVVALREMRLDIEEKVHKAFGGDE